MICPQFYPLVGGYERNAERLSRRLIQRGIPTTVVTFRRGDALKDEVIDGLPVKRLGYLPYRGFSTLSGVISLVWCLVGLGRRYRIWHAHAPCLEVAAGLYLAKLIGIPTVLKMITSGQGGINAAASGGVLGRLGLTGSGLKTATAAIAISEQIEREARRFFTGKTIIRRISNVVDTDEFFPIDLHDRQSVRKRLLSRPRDIVVVTVARLARPKNHALLLRTWAELPAEQRGRVNLVLVGDGPLRGSLETLAQDLRLTNDVTFVGSAANVADWCRAADLFVLASDWEGQANSMLEAMACGLPIVLTATGGSEWVSRAPACGIVVPPGDGGALLQAVQTLLNDSELRRTFGRNGRARVVAEASLDHIASLTIDLYQTAADRIRERSKRSINQSSKAPSRSG